MKKSASAAAMAAVVMTSFVPVGLIASKATSRTFSELACRGALGAEWTGDGGPGSCDAPLTLRRSN